MAHSYSHLYNLPSTGLRFFTVYGPWGRPDMALFLLQKQLLKANQLRFNNGEMIETLLILTILKSMISIINKIPFPDKNTTPNNNTILVGLLIEFLILGIQLQLTYELH